MHILFIKNVCFSEPGKPFQVFPISVPSLSDRKQDIVLLADHFLKKAAEEEAKNIEGFSLDVLNKMENYHWPGNIRELENLMRRTVLLTTTNIL